jgi:hypothetical protein
MNHVIVVADTCSQATQERGHEPDALVITALSKYCHDKSMHVVLVGEIAAEVNESRKDLGQEADLTPRAVGSILQSLGLLTDKVSSFGRGLRLNPPVQRRVHQLLQIYRLKPVGPTAECTPCKEMRYCGP